SRAVCGTSQRTPVSTLHSGRKPKLKPVGSRSPESLYHILRLSQRKFAQTLSGLETSALNTMNAPGATLLRAAQLPCLPPLLESLP
ncbi:MAG: hypothetical protein ACRD1G_20025, partial [Acidimicrobiales bacterium]